MKAQPSEGSPARRSPLAGFRRLLAPLLLPLLVLNFYGGISPPSLLFLFLSFFKLQDDVLIPRDQNQRPGGSTPLGPAFILFPM